MLVIFKAGHARARALGHEVVAWLRARGFVASLCEAGAAEIGAGMARPARCAIVLGGDGTLLGVARRFAFSGVPLFGINFGRVGFLTSADPANWQERLESALSDAGAPRGCHALRWQLIRRGQPLADGAAINDVVVARGGLARLVGLRVRLDGCDMGTLRCDGLLCCTPLGSSGYSASAGGAILHPCMDAMGLTPLCPYPDSASPLVLPGRVVCRVGVTASAEAWLTVDGQEGQPLEGDDEVVVSGAPDGVRFLGHVRFFERLRVRGFALDSGEEERGAMARREGE